jgi:hypothetical protein
MTREQQKRARDRMLLDEIKLDIQADTEPDVATRLSKLIVNNVAAGFGKYMMGLDVLRVGEESITFIRAPKDQSFGASNSLLVHVWRRNEERLALLLVKK